MRKILLFLAVFFTYTALHSQSVVFHENFEPPSFADSVTAVPASSWNLSSRLSVSGMYSDTSVVVQNDTTRLITDAFSTVGNSYVMLEFWHICKIEFMDFAQVYVSINNGSTWTKLGGQHYHGGGFFSVMGEKFSAATYVDWQAANTSAVPTNNWWKKELFDISSIAGNQSQVKVMFLLGDGNSNGAAGNYGWLIDDIKVTASTGELFPPQLSFIPPVLKDSVFNLGPFPIYVSAFDSSGIDTVKLHYSRNHGPFNTIGMIYNSGTQYFVFIDTLPAFSLYDTVSYYVEAVDQSPSANMSRIPALGYNAFVLFPPQPPPGCTTPITVFPFIEDFDSWPTGSTACGAINPTANGWINAIEPTNGTDWSAYSGNTPTANTGPTFDNTSGSGKYVFVESTNCNNREAYLLTPCLDISGVESPTLEFYYHMFGSTMGELHVDIWLGNQWELDIIPPITGDKGNAWHKAEVNLTPYKGVTQIRFRAITGTGGFSDMAIDDVKVWQPPANDAGIVALNYPVSPAPTGVLPIHASIRNFGSSNLTKVKVQFEVNSALQPVYQWNGLLPSGTQSDSVLVGTFNFPSGPATIKMWTFEPNDSIDGFNQNDTIIKSIIACTSPLRGVFSVGGATADFNTINDAVFALQHCGVDSAVIMRINPGTYNQQLTFDTIPGASATNTITFESSTGDSTDVVIEFASSGAQNNWVIQIDRAQHLIFKSLTVRATGTTHGRVFEFINGAHNNTITNCVIQTDVSLTSSFFAGIYSASNTPGSNNLTVTNNHFIGGYYGIYWYGTSAIRRNKLTVINNMFTEFRYYGIMTYFVDSLIINENELITRANTTISYGLQLYYTNGYGEVFKNKVHMQGTSSQYGITIGYKQAASTDYITVVNNFVSQAVGTGTAYGIYIIGSHYVNVYYNNVNITGGSATGGRALFQSSGSNINIVNNIFANTGGGYAYYINTPNAISTSNHNNFYATGTNLAYWSAAHTTLAALRIASSKDANSLSVDPEYESISDLHINSTSLWQAGTPIPGIIDDIDGDPRSPSAPTIGADEVEPIPIDAGITAIIEPTGPLPEGASSSLEVVLNNFGTDIIQAGMLVQYSLNSASWTNYTHTSAILPLSSDTVTLTTLTVPSGPNNICVRTQLVGDTNVHNDEFCKYFYGIPQTDVGVIGMLAPDTGICYSANEPVSVQIRNHGSQTFNFVQNPVTVQVTVSGAVTQTLTPVIINQGTLPVGAVMNVNITNNFAMTTSGLYTFNARTICAADGDTTNDAMTPRILQVFATVTALPFMENFESFNQGIGNYDPGTFDNGWSADPVVGGFSVYQWKVRSGPTATIETGPSGDNTTGTGHYMYVDSRYGAGGSHAMFISPCIDLSQFSNPALRFYYHMYGIHSHSLRVDVLYNGHWYLSVGAISGQNQSSESDAWKQKIVDLSNYTGLIRLRFRAIKGIGNKGDIAIDDIMIYEPMPIDAGVSQFLRPSNFYNQVGQNQTIEIRVENVGFDTIKSMTIGYMAGNAVPVSHNWTGTLLPYQHLNYTFTTPYTVIAGEVPIKAFVSCFGDGNSSNDTSTIIFTGLPLIPVPYYDDFNGPGYWVASGGFRQWERGTPGGNVINTAYKPPNAWMTNLNANYMNNSADYLYTPFFDFSQVSGAEMRFRNNYDTQPNNDACMIQYSTDGGNNWSMLGYISVPGSQNWYNSNIGGTHCWTGTSSGWEEAVFELSQFNNAPNPVQFRFYFLSNASINSYDGWAIDDFAITLPQISNDAGVLRITEPITQPATGTAINPKVMIMNFGGDTLTSIPLEYSINNGTPVVETWTGNLVPGDSVEYTFTTASTISGAFSICARTQLAGDIYTYNDQACREYSTDIGVTYFYMPLSNTIAGDSITVTVRIDNFGSEVVTAFDIAYQINVFPAITEQWTGILEPQTFTDYTFKTKYVSLPVMYQICAYTLLPGDNSPVNDKVCKYVTGGVGVDVVSSQSFVLGQNRPNPAKDVSIIPFSIPKSGEVVLEIADLRGRKLKTVRQMQNAGEGQFEIHTSEFANGVYIYTMRYKGTAQSKLMVVGGIR